MTAIKEFEDKVYCDFTSAATKAISGKDILLCIFNSTGDQLLAVSGQQGLTINREKEIIEIDSKTIEGGWKSKVPGIKDWSIDLDGVFATDETSSILQKAFDNDEYTCIKVVNNRTKKAMFGGLTLIQSMNLEAPHDDAVTFSTTLEGCGKLVDLTSVESVTAHPSNIKPVGEDTL